MTKLETMDYLRLCSLHRRTISVPIPAELVARKGTSRVARARCQRVQDNLRAAVHAELRRAARRPFRREVAIHLALTGVSIVQAGRTVKALIDSLKGPVYTDDRAVTLLDVEVSSGPLSATISACSAREYADAFDVLCGASADRDDDDRPAPWAWDRDALDEDHGVELARENLAETRADTSIYPPDVRAMLIEMDEWRIREHELRALLATPYSPTDRPGPPSLAGRLWNDHAHLGGPACIVLPAPHGGEGSWTDRARQACDTHFERWPGLVSVLGTEPVALDIAIGGAAADVFDVDNLARRVLRALRDRALGLPSPSAYRAYRRHGDDDSVVVRLHAASRANDLRWLLGGSALVLCGVRPDPDVPAHRRRSIDDEMYERMRVLG